ncbi:hypothetical protein AAG906_035875 [Vitis piasezkii]|uniref:50S ribosomal protein L35 n=2 Tax=Vitis vinifera TaxID=29760 RepID=F6HCP0_VITVI|nr:large ribosomal subunit protein bL35c [Vitis vinifera]XP_034679023.1 50S ribosomal protein L35, chloroplastic [Vitis riparia]WKA06689.1 hypothetical protein VitviT2T_024579 [Vitis vinifera]CAN63703.1 hypothetical protein VITISV_039205 [Vitis vinifera]CAN77631.1 hypothetical protein VITISV_001803 [Vitis vinifera]|eukprot:XP_002267813.1 PREDICTED: 50S ribosomal protein L35, chloroplastic [Vitis vinifera]
MASATLMLSFSLRLPSSFSSPSSVRVPNEVVQFSPFSRACSLKLSSSRNISGFAPILPLRHSTLNSPSPSQPSSLTVVSAKGYKMKTHKASAKRFRVTGRGKIVRRRAGKQHLLAKKNAKRRLRLSKMHPVSRSDYDNVIGALPYLKVNREAK